MWTNTKKALTEFENSLRCGVCKNLALEPCNLGRCEHFFCQTCTEEHQGRPCPVCGLPSHVKDKQVNRQLESAAALCLQLKHLIDKNEDNPDKDCPTSPANLAIPVRQDKGITGSVKFEDPCEMKRPLRDRQNNEPKLETDEDFPLSRRTRRATKQKNKELHLANINKTWGIGEEYIDPCASCKRSSYLKVKLPNAKSSADSSLERKITQKLDLYGLDIDSSSKSDGVVPDNENMVESIKSSHHNEISHGHGGSSKLPANKTSADHLLESTDGEYESQSTACSSKMSTSRKSRSLEKLNTSLPSTPKSSNALSWISPKQGTPLSRRLSHGFASPAGSTPKIKKKNTKGETLLQVACIKGDFEVVKNLLQDGSEVNTRDNAGWTPLHEAAQHGFMNIIKLLLDNGAVINVPGGPENDTPLHDALRNHKIDCVELLVSRGASVTQRNLHGETPEGIATTDHMKKALQTKVDESKLSEVKIPAEIINMPIVLLGTGLKDRKEKSLFSQCAQLLHAQTVDEFGPTVTHVVTGVNKNGMCPRTLKYLFAVLSGKWIVNMEWVLACLEYESHVSEEPFEVPGASTSPDSMAAHKGRTNSEKQLPRLFSGCHFYLRGNFEYPTPPKQHIIELIETGGGQILTREPRLESITQSQYTVPHHAIPGSQLQNCSYYILHDSQEPYGEMMGTRLCKVPVSWFMDSIAQFKLLNFAAK